MMEPGGVSNKYTPAEANANTTSCLNDLAGCEQKKKKTHQQSFTSCLKQTLATLNVIFRNRKMFKLH